MEQSDAVPPDLADPAPEHAWLRRLEGDWRTVDENDAAGWEERVRCIGDVWVMFEGRGTTPDGRPGESVMMLGYCPKRRRFVGTWIGSMMTHMWVYDGELDAEQRVLTLETAGPDFTVQGRTAPYRDFIELVDDDHRDLRSEVRQEDGTWTEIMRVRYRRR